MTPELVGAASALLGVALGIVGTLGAARIQAKGAHAQADATYRAAVTTAQVQYAGTIAQQSRAAQRAAYVRFLTTAHAFELAVRPAREQVGSAQVGSTDDPLAEPMRELRAAFATVELEGPQAILEAADAVTDNAAVLAYILREHASELEAWDTLGEAAYCDPPATEAREATDALNAVVAAQRNLPRDVQDSFAERPDDADALAGTGTLGVIYTSARTRAETALLAVAASGVLTDEQANMLLWDVTGGARTVRNAFWGRQSALEDAISSFTHAARDHLNDVTAELS
ncbi:hypothetical protein [Streptomyces sp. NPDC006463]|uniref:hypothetical protein n=1 Tax=Streptomyces sp. NPDC006463 TaxID=3364746 RepID=UPI0036CDC351